MGKLGEMLSDEESVRQLSELAQMINDETERSEQKSESSIPDMSGLMKISGLLGSVKEDDSNVQLLAALKPHLKKERQQRVDKAIKLLKVLSVWNAAKDSGILSDII